MSDETASFSAFSSASDSLAASVMTRTPKEEQAALIDALGAVWSGRFRSEIPECDFRSLELMEAIKREVCPGGYVAMWLTEGGWEMWDDMTGGANEWGGLRATKAVREARS